MKFNARRSLSLPPPLGLLPPWQFGVCCLRVMARSGFHGPPARRVLAGVLASWGRAACRARQRHLPGVRQVARLGPAAEGSASRKRLGWPRRRGPGRRWSLWEVLHRWELDNTIRRLCMRIACRGWIEARKADPRCDGPRWVSCRAKRSQGRVRSPRRSSGGGWSRSRRIDERRGCRDGWVRRASAGEAKAIPDHLHVARARRAGPIRFRSLCLVAV
jgi:hypothetical protein